MQELMPFGPAPLDEEEVGIEKSLRPSTLAEFIGQRRVVENLRIAIGAARARRDVLDHVLFSGMPGLGKTTLSMLIAGELGSDFHCTSGPAIEKGKDLLGCLSRVKRGDVLFIDEIHRMSCEAEEYLYSAMEDYKVDIVVSGGAEAQSYRISVEPFTLVGATTREGMLSPPFRSRFGIIEKLEPYPVAELIEIIHRSAQILGCSIAAAAAEFLGERCRGTPRYANRFLRRIRDLAQFRGQPGGVGPGTGAAPLELAAPLVLTASVVEEALDRLGIDAHGLDRTDRRIIELLLDTDEPVGVKTIAVTIGEEERTIEDVHEPYLIQRGMLVKTPRGRRPSARAHDLYGTRTRSIL